jgi:hypothetical protein
MLSMWHARVSKANAASCMLRISCTVCFTICTPVAGLPAPPRRPTHPPAHVAKGAVVDVPPRLVVIQVADVAVVPAGARTRPQTLGGTNDTNVRKALTEAPRVRADYLMQAKANAGAETEECVLHAVERGTTSEAVLRIPPRADKMTRTTYTHTTHAYLASTVPQVLQVPLAGCCVPHSIHTMSVTAYRSMR